MDGTFKQDNDAKPGILRGEATRPRRISGADRLGSELAERVSPSSPQPSVDRLSVTWADVEDSSSKVNVFIPGSPPGPKMEVKFPVDEASEEEDYSASVSAIIQRRASSRRSKRGPRGSISARRTSSPFIPELSGSIRRRSSGFTTSSGETAISIEEGQEVTQEQIYENIRLHKEVLGSVKQHPWGMRRKLRLVHQAKAYIKKHEGTLQERLAKNRCTRDILARFNILLARQCQRLSREVANLSNWIIPWESRIKEIESHFGSVVASYFTFLRWLFWVNFVISIILVLFVVVPEILTADKDAGERKEMLPEEKVNSTNLRTLWEFEGVLKYSPMFYGYYNIRKANTKGGYHLPMAYLMTGIAVYIYSFVALLRKMAENSRMSKLSEKEDECVFSWKLFTGWDYMIGNAETAHNKTASIVLGFKEALLEEAEKVKSFRKWRVIFKRVLVNMCILVLLCASAYAVVLVVGRSKEPGAESNLWRRNEITIVISLISFIFPMFFEALGFFESYHPRKQLRIQLARIMVLNLLNLYSLIFALFDKIDGMTKELSMLNPNHTVTIGPPTSKVTGETVTLSTFMLENSTSHLSTINGDLTTTSKAGKSICYKVFVPCATTPIMTIKNMSTTMMSILLINQSTMETTLPYDQYNTNFSYDNYTDSYSKDISEPTIMSNLNFQSTEMPNLDNQTAVISYESPDQWSTSSGKSSTIFDNFAYYNYKSDYNYTDEEFDYKYVEEDDSYPSDEGYKPDNFTSEFHNHTLTDKSLDYDTSTFQNIHQSLSTNNLTPLLDIKGSNWTDESTENYTSTISWDTESTTFDHYSTTKSHSASQDYADFYQEPCYIIKCDDVESHVKINETGNLIDDKFVAKRELIPKQNALITDKYEFKSAASSELNITVRKKLRSLCWETMFGQELVKLTVMDLVLTILSTLTMDFFRALFVRYMNKCWCWDLEKTFPQYGDFKIAENILHLVNNQGMVWMGMFFSPGLVVLNIVKLIILMYLRSWTVMTCNVPHEVVFRASRSNNFYLALLLTMIFLCVLPVGYAIVWVEPSWHCGPFSNYHRIYHLFTQSLQSILSPTLRKALDYIASPGIVIPLLVLLVLIIYYLLSLTGSLREANNDLKIQLRRERTEERRKMFQIADKRSRGGDIENTPFAKWRKIMPSLPTNRLDENEEENVTQENGKFKLDGKDCLAKLVRTAMRKSSGTSDDESGLAQPQHDDETDTDFHESLPDDVLLSKDIQLSKKQSNKSDVRHVPTHKKKQNVSDSEKKEIQEKHTRAGHSQGEFRKFRDRALRNQKRELKSFPEDDVFKVSVEDLNKTSNLPLKETQIEGDKNRDIKTLLKDKIKLMQEDKKEEKNTLGESSNIPVIMISKTASEENVLKNKETNNENIVQSK